MSALLDSIKRHEGYRSRVYKDSLGIDTIGYGFAIKDLVLSETVSTIILSEKIATLTAEVHEKFSWLKNKPDHIQDVVIEMCYQLGVTGVSRFKNTLKAMQDERWDDAADGMLSSLWARQTPSRAKELSEIVRKTV